MYQDTEAFSHYSWNSPEETKKSGLLTFTSLEIKIRKIWNIEKLPEKNVEIMGTKLFDKKTSD